MALIGSDFAKFPMGGGWADAVQAERDKYIRLMLTRLAVYGITDSRVYSDVELGGLSVYVRRLFELEGIGEIEPPDFVVESLEVSLVRTPPAFSFDAIPGEKGIPEPPPEGTAILVSDKGQFRWVEFPLPDPASILNMGE